VESALQTERNRHILRCLVDNHVSTASPVGSKSIAGHTAMRVSPATIRNTMVELEEAGYISRPHSSAGGVPTDKGYRFYVDRLIESKPPAPADRKYIDQKMQCEWKSIQEILAHTSHVLGMVCKELGVALTPRLYEGDFQRLELVPVAPRKVLLVLMLTSGLVRNIVAELDSDIPSNVLEETCRILNERLTGCSLLDIKKQADERLKDMPRADRNVVQLFIQYSDYLCDFQESEQVHMGGATHIVSQPEFTDHLKLSRLLDFVEHRQTVAEWLHKRDHQNNVAVTIGHEHFHNEMHVCSVVTSTYTLGDITGVIGVIGPTRMPYSRLMGIVGYTAHRISTLLS